MKNISRHVRILGIALFTLCLAISMVSGVKAENGGKEFTGKHPIRILKARAQNDNMASSISSTKGSLTIWVQNITSVVVDGINIDVDLYNSSKRKVESLHRKIDKLEPGEKKVITFRWDVLAEKEVKPRFYVEYNARGNQKARFEGDTPSWN